MSAAEDALAPARRHQHILPDGRVAYEWSQSLNDVTVLVATVPEGVRGRDLDVCIERGRCRLGLRGNPPYLDHATFSAVKASESFWTLEDGVLHLHLTKADPGEPWAAAFAGHEKQKTKEGGEQASDASDDDTSRLLLERFQREHPGFDFSGAQFSGAAPDPRTFLKDLEDQEEREERK